MGTRRTLKSARAGERAVGVESGRAGKAGRLVREGWRGRLGHRAAVCLLAFLVV